MTAATTDTPAPPVTTADFLADAQQRLDDLLPHLRPGTVAFDLHRIAALLTAALRDVAAPHPPTPAP